MLLETPTLFVFPSSLLQEMKQRSAFIPTIATSLKDISQLAQTSTLRAAFDDLPLPPYRPSNKPLDMFQKLKANLWITAQRELFDENAAKKLKRLDTLGDKAPEFFDEDVMLLDVVDRVSREEERMLGEQVEQDVVEDEANGLTQAYLISSAELKVEDSEQGQMKRSFVKSDEMLLDGLKDEGWEADECLLPLPDGSEHDGWDSGECLLNDKAGRW